MPGGTVASAITILFLLVVLVGMLFNKETVVSVVIGIIFLVGNCILLVRGHHKNDGFRKVK